MTPNDIDALIRTVLRQHARLGVDPAEVEAESDLYALGMSSHASVNVMLGLEASFDIEFPDPMLKRSVFRSIASLRGAVCRIGVPQTV